MVVIICKLGQSSNCMTMYKQTKLKLNGIRMPQIRSSSILDSGMYTNNSQSNQIKYDIAFYEIA